MAYLTDSGISIGKASSRDGNALITDLNQKEPALHTITRSQGFYGAADRQQLSLNALKQLLNYETARPGRKLVIWISPGWPLLTGPDVELTPKNQQWVFNTIVGLSDGLRQARITLYQIDPLGMADAGEWRTSYYEEFVKGVKNATRCRLETWHYRFLPFKRRPGSQFQQRCRGRDRKVRHRRRCLLCPHL